jgi:hypothetical protein
VPEFNEGVMEPDELLTTLLTNRRPPETVRQLPPGPHMWSPRTAPLVAQPGPQTVRAPRATEPRTECAAGGSNDRRAHRRPPPAMRASRALAHAPHELTPARAHLK